MLLPLLTEQDPLTTSEGSVDPLGMYAIADSLAVRLVPGVRERQSHPRFLTAMAVSLAVCSEFDDDTVAADGISEPWQVFEWYMVEGLVRTASDDTELTGLPGRDKVAAAVRDGVPLSRQRYLKNPSVVGFHGVYRILSRGLGIEMAGRLGEAGYELLRTWAKEQGLGGFYGTTAGDGTAWRERLRDAVADGLAKAATTRSPGWGGWKFFDDCLRHTRVGRRERKVLAQHVLQCDDGFRGQVLDFLVSSNGLEALAGWLDDEQPLQQAERQFHLALSKQCGPALRGLLEAIMAYESFAALLQNAFDGCLDRMAQARGRTSLAELRSLPSLARAAKEIPAVFEVTTQKLTPFGDALVRFQQGFAGVSERLPTDEWVNALLDHHRNVQRQKPPNGKMPWFDRYDDGACALRQRYVRDYGSERGDGYVHAYRTGSLTSFAQDLRLVK